MVDISLTLQEAEIKEALRDYVIKKGLVISDRVAATAKAQKGDRPFDSDWTYATVSGVHLKRGE